jgi:hypothetical protein
VAILLLGLAAGAAGCRSDLRGKGFEEDPDFNAGHLRAPDPHNKEKWGFSNKSRQIEENLGLR